MKVLPLLFFLVLAGLLPSYPSSQTGGFKYYDNYTSRDYKWNPQNWGIVQDKKGIIYVGNGGGLLQFDGADWKVIRVPNNLVRSLAIHDSGTVYIGGRGEIGFLAPDPTIAGALRYVSLKKHLEPKEKGFDSVYRTHATQKGIYFRTAKFLFRWNPKTRQMKTWKPKHQFKYSSTHGEQFFIHDREAGLMRMVGELLKLVPEGKEFVGKKIYMMVPYDDNNLLIGTRDNGFFLYNGAKVTPFPTQIDGYLKEKQLSHGIRLQSNPREFAMTTLLGGLLIMDSQGRLKYVFDGSSGLWEDNVKYVFEDSLGNLWLALQKGLSKLEYASSVRFYNKDSNLTDIVLSVIRHNGVIYAGTSTNGLYVLDANGRFRSIPGITGSCHSLLSTGDALLTASTNGVYLIENQICRKIIDTRSYVLYRSRLYPNRLWAGTQSGLVSLSLIPGNTWLEEHRLPSVSQTVRSIVENPDGSMWLGITPSGVLKVDSPGTPARSRVTSYDTSDGLPGGQINVFEAAGHVMFATDKGIYRFHKEKNAFVPDQTLGDFFAGGTRKVFRINEDRHKNIWLHSKSMTYQATPHPDQNYRFRTVPLRTTDGAQVNAIYPDPDGKTIWLATISGLYYYDTSVVKITPYTTYIRQVEANGITVFADESPSSSSQINKTSGTKPNEPVLTIKYPDRNLRFQFAAPFFEAESETEYHYSLEGYDKDWSAWKAETQKDYTNLDPGLYTFKVLANNIQGEVSEEARFKFKILPPWYRTWWAFILYALLFFAVVYLSVKWRSRRLEQEKLRLENIVDERTQEVSQQNQLLEEQSQKLKELDRVKSRFFANISHEFRTPLTLIMGPLEQMLAASGTKEQQQKIDMMLRNSQRLMRLINQLLDLSRFDSGKMTLQASQHNIVLFLKFILESFHLLADQKKLNLEFHSQVEDTPLYFDLPKMEEVIYNLLINAVKFTPGGGTITVSVTRATRNTPGVPGRISDFLKISVRDTGIGMSREQMAQVFDRFYRVEGGGEGNFGGTGIGLALAKESVTLHHGQIDVHSTKGQGTEFVVHLPLGKDHLKPGEIVESENISTLSPTQKPGQPDEIDILHPETRQSDAHDSPAQNQEKQIVLVVDDNADMRQYIRGPLDPLYAVVEAQDGKEGIQKAKEVIPDLIISDVMMPQVDGFELCHTLKKDVETSHIPIILLTAKVSEDSIIEGLKTGADDYIAKPFNTNILIARIKNLIDLRRQLQLKFQRQTMLMPAEVEVSPIDREFIEEFREVVEQNLSDPDLKSDTLCKKLIMSRMSLFRKVEALTGETPKQFIKSYRLQRAAQLLKDNFGNVTDIALEVGFSSSAYFAKSFKDKYHQTPSDFQSSNS